MYRMKRFVCTLLAVLIAVCALVIVKVMHLSRFTALEGERTYFLDSASSQALQKTNLLPLDILRVKGECVAMDISDYVGDRYLLKEEIAREISGKYQAEIVFMEEVCGVISYYAYTSAWSDGVWLYGQKINLHIAIDGEKLLVGSPIIFGGY